MTYKLQKYMQLLDALPSEGKGIGNEEIKELLKIKKEGLGSFLDAALQRGEALKLRDRKVISYLATENTRKPIDRWKEYDDFCKRLETDTGIKNGSGLEMCIGILETVNKDFKALNVSTIRKKTYSINSSNFCFRPCLSFLEQEEYVGVRSATKEEIYGRMKNVYFAVEKGINFIAGWHSFVSEFNIDDLERQL